MSFLCGTETPVLSAAAGGNEPSEQKGFTVPARIEGQAQTANFVFQRGGLAPIMLYWLEIAPVFCSYLYFRWHRLRRCVDGGTALDSKGEHERG